MRLSFLTKLSWSISYELKINEKLISKYFDLDTDNDGLISKKEMIDAHRFRINKIFYKYDKNYDGKLSKEEFQASREGLKKRLKKRMKCEIKNGRQSWNVYAKSIWRR